MIFLHPKTKHYLLGGSILLVLFFAPAALLAHGGGHLPGLVADQDPSATSRILKKDAAGRPLEIGLDLDGDGQIDVWNYFAEGRLIRQEQDTDKDGRPDVRLMLNSQGQPTSGEMDLDLDGVTDTWEQYVDGSPVFRSVDYDNDGLVNIIFQISGGRYTTIIEDTDQDGKLDRWSYLNAEGLTIRLEYDHDGDGFPDPEPDDKPTPDTTVPNGSMESEPETATAIDESDELTVQLDEEVVREHRALTSASDLRVRRDDFAYFPRQNPSDLVRLIPGVHVSQHTGGAKAYQYFLRGFDAEHGQDLAAYLDGIPLNEPSQVHGHGYLDLHFLIPETLAAIRIIKGPYDPEFGNFATAGAINFIPRRSAEQNTVSATAGMFGTVKVQGTFGVQADPYILVGAVESDHSDGYTDPGDTDAIRANTGHTFIASDWGINLMTNHYAQNSAATDVIPQKWVKEGRIDRYGSLDSSDRVVANRHLIGATADWLRGPHELRLQGFYDYKRTTIWSNYTFFLLNPELGDQQEMQDNRNALGLNLRYRHAAKVGPTVWNTAVGFQWRSDLVRQILANATKRQRWNVINDLDFSENALGLWLRENLLLTKWLTIVPGARIDLIAYQGSGTQDERYFNIYTNQADTLQDQSRDWSETAWIFSPKGSVIFTPLRPWDIFVNYGEGFFSNTTLQMANRPTGEIPKVCGGEVGTRVFFWNRRITVSAAAWQADKQRDMVFDPQTGLSVVKQKTRRRGLDGEIRVSPLPWLYLATDASYVDARFARSGSRIPNGPIFLMTNGLGLNHPLGLRGMVRGRYMGERELDQGDFAPPFYVLDLVAGYDTPNWSLELAVDNLLDAEWEDAVFSYETRPEQNGETLNGIHWTPGTPLAARFTVTAKF